MNFKTTFLFIYKKGIMLWGSSWKLCPLELYIIFFLFFLSSDGLSILLYKVKIPFSSKDSLPRFLYGDTLHYCLQRNWNLDSVLRTSGDISDTLDHFIRYFWCIKIRSTESNNQFLNGNMKYKCWNIMDMLKCNHKFAHASYTRTRR